MKNSIYRFSDGRKGRRVREATRYAVHPLGYILDIMMNKQVPVSNNGADQLIVYLINNEGKRIKRYAHRVICDTLVFPLTANIEVDHIDHDTMNLREDNLRPIIHSNNVLRESPRRRFKGKALSDKAVREIRAAYRSGKTHLEMSKQYGCSRRTIQKVCKGETYRNVV